MYYSTKTYGHSVGLSCCFRQWRAASHCRFLHGYALKIQVVFSCADNDLDSNNWCVDFGGMKTFKASLEQTFDHKTLVAYDDPELEAFESLAFNGMIQLVHVQRTGCEAFSKLVYEMACGWLAENGMAGRVRVVSAEVSEHEGNSAFYMGNQG